jgi:mono/diheme cytochrome c family protein
MRFVLMLACGLVAGLAAGLSAGPTGAAVQDADEIKRGEALLTRHCSGCHAIGRAGTSTHAEAPPFRTLGRKYPIEALEEALGEGIVSGHPDMPEFKFSGPDVGAIVAYLNSIQEK